MSSNDTAPSQTSLHVRVKPIHTVVPFIFYVLGMIDLAVSLAFIPRTFSGVHHSNLFSFSAVGVCPSLANSAGSTS